MRSSHKQADQLNDQRSPFRFHTTLCKCRNHPLRHRPCLSKFSLARSSTCRLNRHSRAHPSTRRSSPNLPPKTPRCRVSQPCPRCPCPRSYPCSKRCFPQRHPCQPPPDNTFKPQCCQQHRRPIPPHPKPCTRSQCLRCRRTSLPKPTAKVWQPSRRPR